MRARGRARGVGAGDQGRRLGRGVPRPGAPADLRHRRRSSRSASPTASASRSSTGTRRSARRQGAAADYTNLIALGEVLLGYPNEYGRYTDAAADRPGARSAARATCRRPRTCPTGATSGRNGTYLVFRQLHQDVPRLLAVPRPAGGRRRRGALAPGRGHGRPHPGRRAAGAARPRADRRRRARAARTSPPTTSPTPATRTASAARSAPTSGAPTRAPATCRAGTQGCGRAPAAHARLQARVVPRRPDRVGALPPPAAPRPRVRRRRSRPRRRCSRRATDEERGLHFICLVAQHLAPVRVRAERLDREHQVRGPQRRERPAAGQPRAAGRASRRDRRLHACPRLGRAGAPASPACRSSSPCAAAPISSCPGIRALRYIAGAPSTRPIAGAGAARRRRSALWNPVLLTLHRGARGRAARRAPARAVLPPGPQPGRSASRWPAVLQCLINRRRPNEGLGLAEERIAARRGGRACSRSSRASPTTCGAPTGRATTSAAATPRPTASCAPRCIVRDDLPEHMRRGIFADAAHLPGLRALLRAPAPTCRTTSRTSASSACRSS